MNAVNRTFSALFVVGVSFLAAVGIQSSSAADSDDGVATTELNSGLLYWLVRSRWWCQTPDRPAAPTLSDISHDGVTAFWTAPESAVFEIAAASARQTRKGLTSTQETRLMHLELDCVRQLIEVYDVSAAMSRSTSVTTWNTRVIAAGVSNPALSRSV